MAEVDASHERDSDIADSPISNNGDDISDGEGEDSGEEMQIPSVIDNHNDVINKLKMQVRDIKDHFDERQLHFPLTNRLQPGIRDDVLPLALSGFPFQHPGSFMPPLQQQHAAPSSGSSHSSEGSAPSPQTWSFEEQFKQVRQLYEINDDPKRKEFLDDLFSFMQKKGAPINRLPIMAKSVLDLYELYNLVIARGGLVDVINKKLWQEIIKGLHLPSSITSAAFTLRTQYMKYLYPYECEKKRLSTPNELQAAIDGNRREGRRSSYGQYDNMTRSPGMHPTPAISPIQLVNQHQLAARMNSVMAGGLGLQNGALHPSHPQPMNQQINGCPANLAPHEYEARIMEYMKLLNKEVRNTYGPQALSNHSLDSVPDVPGITPMDVTRLQLFSSLYSSNNNALPNALQHEPQKEALNLSDTNIPSSMSIKREADTDISNLPKKTTREEENRKSTIPSAHFKIESRGNSKEGDNSVVVSMELNGVMYQGVLFAQTTNGRTV